MFGFYRSSFNGCGWIATYNATIMLGKRVAPAEIIGEYELTGAVLYGTFGIQPYAITAFFQNKGYKVTTTYDSSKFDKVAKENRANIIWFWHSSGTHYVALKWDGTKFVGYNTFKNSSGSDNWGTSISAFLAKYGYTGSILISMS